MWSRRSFLRLAGGTTGAAFALRSTGIAEVRTATAAVAERSPEEVAADESYWREIQFAFMLDRTLINLNNGNQCPSPTVVHEACKRYMDWSNQAPVYHRGLIERNIETARRRLGAEFGASPHVGHENAKDPKLSYRGLRVTPNIYTPLEEIDTFVEAMQNVVKNGLPA